MKKIHKSLFVCVMLVSFAFVSLQGFAVFTSGANAAGGVHMDRGKVPPPPVEQPDEVIPWGIERIDAIAAAALVDESTVIVAVLDTGMDLDHPDLADNYLWGWDVVNGDSSPEDDNGHGTHCAGTIAGIDNEIGVVGVAPNVGLYAIKVLNRRGSGTNAQVATGIIMATEGPDGIPGTNDDADVISMSLSGGYAVEIEDAINYALAYGVVVCCATGNDGYDYALYPAAYDGTIAVGATDINDVVADWSNGGEDILAPGVSVFSTYLSANYATMSGTSMATPHVAGVCALAIAAHPSYSNTQIFDLITGSADAAGVVNCLAVV